MRKFAKFLAVLFAVILAVSVFAFAADGEEEKTYIVYPKFALFTEPDNPAGFYVVNEEELNMLLEEDMVESYRETITGQLLGDGDYDSHWDIKAIKAFDVHNEYTGEGIRVGIIDSGIDRLHPNFLEISITSDSYEEKGTRVIYGYNYKDNTADPIITQTENGQAITMATTDIFGHGTAVAGKVGAYIQPYYKDGNNNLNQNWGISGTAPGVTLIPLKVTDSKSVNDVPVIKAIYGAVDDFDCDVINISIGFAENVPEMEAAIDYAVGKGVTVVAAVGNNGTSQLMYPAAYDNVIGVGATDADGNVWVNVDPVGGSQQNESVFVTAPGADVEVTWSYDAEGEPILDAEGNKQYDENGKLVDKKLNFKRVTGTSLSAPLVSGAVALLKQANPDLTPAEIMSILAESATDAGIEGYDTAYGHGILNVEAALELVLDENRAPSTVTYRVTAEDEALYGAITVADYVIGNIGSHPLGASFTAKAEPEVTVGNDTYKFAYWANGNGTHVSGDATYTFNATSNFSLYAVYDKITDSSDEITEKKVEFWNGNGILLGTKTANDDGKILSADIPENPTMTGFAFSEWLDEDEKTFTADSILEKNLTRVVAQFTDATTQYSITFDDVGDADTEETGVYGKKVTYTAIDDGFDYWKLGEKIVSYDKGIEIALWGENKTLTAVYDAENFDVKPTVVLDEGADNANFLIYAVPNGYTIVDAGIVFGTEGSTPRVSSFHSKASVKDIPESGFGQFTSLPGDESHEEARGYLIYKDTNNVTRVIYSN